MNSIGVRGSEFSEARNLQLMPTLEKQQTLIQTVVQVAVRIFYVLTIVLMAGVLFPIHSFAIGAVAVGAAVLSGLFYLEHKENAPEVLEKLPPLPPIKKIAEVPFVPASFSPRGLYHSGMNCAFNSLIHFLNSDPDTAKRLRLPIDREKFEDTLLSFGAPARLIEEFHLYLQQKSIRPSMALKLFLNEYQPQDEEISQLETFVGNYNRFLKVVRPFSQFLEGYDRAIENNSSLVDRNSQSIRYALNHLNPVFPADENKQIDPAYLLEYLVDSLPDRHRIEYEEAGERKQVWGFSMKIDDTASDLGKMFESRCSKGIVFPQPPPILRFHIERFIVDPNNLMDRLKSVWNPILKIATPIEIPEEIRLSLTNGSEQTYRLTGLVASIGDSLSKSHFIAGRIIDDERYWIDDTQVIPVDRQIWAEQLLPQAYLLCYIPVPEKAGS